MTRSDIHINVVFVLLACVLSLIIGSAFNIARAGEDPGELFNYSFAVWLGSGVYQVKGADPLTVEFLGSNTRLHAALYLMQPHSKISCHILLFTKINQCAI